MNKLIGTLCSSVFALSAAYALAQDNTMVPLSKMGNQDANAAAAAAHAKWQA